MKSTSVGRQHESGDAFCPAIEQSPGASLDCRSRCIDIIDQEKLWWQGIQDAGNQRISFPCIRLPHSPVESFLLQARRPLQDSFDAIAVFSMIVTIASTWSHSFRLSFSGRGGTGTIVISGQRSSSTCIMKVAIKMRGKPVCLICIS